MSKIGEMLTNDNLTSANDIFVVATNRIHRELIIFAMKKFLASLSRLYILVSICFVGFASVSRFPGVVTTKAQCTRKEFNCQNLKKNPTPLGWAPPGDCFKFKGKKRPSPSLDYGILRLLDQAGRFLGNRSKLCTIITLTFSHFVH